MAVRKTRRTVRWWFKPLALILSLGLFAILGEAVLRFRGVDVPTSTVLGMFFQHDSSAGWVGRPNATGTFQTASFSVVVRHDADGLRESGLDTLLRDDRPATMTVNGSSDAAQPNERDRRVCWIFGDSDAWGWGVADDAHYTALLNASCGEKMQFRNLGVPGYSTVQQYCRLRSLLASGLRPDVVIVTFNNGNDLLDNIARMENDPPRPHYQATASSYRFVGPPVARSWNYEVGSFLKRHSVLVGYLSYHLKRAKHARRGFVVEAEDPAITCSAPLEIECPPEAKICLKSVVASMQEECRQASIEFAMVSDLRMDSRLRAVCEESDVHLVDLGQHLERMQRTSQGNLPIRFAFDEHPNETAHQLIATALQDELHAWHPEWRLKQTRVELAREPEAGRVIR
ncbi:MAG: GDSL-type esterase/lipase family protein [Pirellulales bacterium]